MRRSSCIQNQQGIIKLPTKLKPIFEQQKMQILKRIQFMIANNALPTSLLLLTPKPLSKTNASPNRTTITLKLIKSQTKAPPKLHTCDFNTIIVNHNCSLEPVKSPKSPKSPRLKLSQYNILEKVKKSIIQAKMANPQGIYNSHADISSNFATLQPTHTKYEIGSLHNVLITQQLQPTNSQSCNSSRPITCQKTRNIVKMQKSNTLNRKQSVKKPGRKIIQAIGHRSSLVITLPKLPYPFTCKHREANELVDKIEDIPLEGWNIS